MAKSAYSKAHPTGATIWTDSKPSNIVAGELKKLGKKLTWACKRPEFCQNAESQVAHFGR